MDLRRRQMLPQGLLPGGAAEAARKGWLAPGRRLPLLATNIIGAAFHGADETAAALCPGALLTLERAAGNAYDKRAVEVRTPGGVKLGYLPGKDHQAVASLLDQGFVLTARVTEILPGQPQPEIRLQVFLSA